MMAWPQRLQGSVDKGGRSPGMNTFASHPGQVTIFKGLSLALIRWMLTLGSVGGKCRHFQQIIIVIFREPVSFLVRLARLVKEEITPKTGGTRPLDVSKPREICRTITFAASRAFAV
jgi:hypothetical protein